MPCQAAVKSSAERRATLTLVTSLASKLSSAAATEALESSVATTFLSTTSTLCIATSAHAKTFYQCHKGGGSTPQGRVGLKPWLMGGHSDLLTLQASRLEHCNCHE